MSRSTCSRTDIAETPLPHGFLDGFEKIVGFQFLYGDLGIARHMEHVRLDNLEARKQVLEIGHHQLLDPHEREVLMDLIVASRFMMARRAFSGRQYGH